VLTGIAAYVMNDRLRPLYEVLHHRSRIRYLSKKNSRILTNFSKRKKIRKNSYKNSLNARVDVAFQQQLKNLMRFTVSC